MIKKEIIKILEEIIEMDNSKDSICKENELNSDRDYYAFYHGYVSSCLKSIIQKEKEDF